MLRQVHGSPKLRLPQAKDAKTVRRNHSVRKLLERLPMRERRHRVRGGQQLGLGGFESPLLEVSEEAPIHNSRTIAYHHPRPIILEFTDGSTLVALIIGS